MYLLTKFNKRLEIDESISHMYVLEILFFWFLDSMKVVISVLVNEIQYISIYQKIVFFFFFCQETNLVVNMIC